MRATKKNVRKKTERIGPEFFNLLRDESYTSTKTVVDVAQEPALILDRNLRVLAANKPYYKSFQADRQDIENKAIYEIGNGQWDIPALRKLLEDILPKQTFFKGFEVTHEFPIIGSKVMMLNARQIHLLKNSQKNNPRNDSESKLFPPIILLAMEDVTEMMNVA